MRVRKALGCYGIDRKEIVKIAFKGQATPWAGIIPPGSMDTVDVTAMCPYDPAKAKALLAEAGYGPQKPLTFELMTNTEKAVFNVIATVIKEQVGPDRRDREHPARRQGHLAEHGHPGRPVRHVRRGPRVPPDRGPELLPVGEHGGLEQRAPHRHQGRRVLRPLREASWIRPSGRPSRRSSRSSRSTSSTGTPSRARRSTRSRSRG